MVHSLDKIKMKIIKTKMKTKQQLKIRWVKMSTIYSSHFDVADTRTQTLKKRSFVCAVFLIQNTWRCLNNSFKCHQKEIWNKEEKTLQSVSEKQKIVCSRGSGWKEDNSDLNLNFYQFKYQRNQSKHAQNCSFHLFLSATPVWVIRTHSSGFQYIHTD